MASNSQNRNLRPAINGRLVGMRKLFRERCYRSLRQWRNEGAKQIAVPSFVIMRNVQLAEIYRKVPRCVRYMDDLVAWSDSKAWLWALADDLAEHVATARSLELKAERTLVAPCSVGVSFLGYRIFPGLIRHQGPRARRRRRLFRKREAA